MRVNLKGIHKIRKRLANGHEVFYYYAWRGGPRIEAEPGSPEFMVEYQRAVETRKEPNPQLLFSLIVEFKQSAEFESLSAASQRSYRTYLKLIEDEFADMPIAALDDPQVRGEFKRWRDTFASTPRKADYAWRTLARVLSVAKDRGRIIANPCEGGGRLYHSDRAEKVWSDEQIAKLYECAPRHVAPIITMALWTGQRQGDILRMPWHAFDGSHIRLRQQKTGRSVVIPVGEPLRHALAELARTDVCILLNSHGRPWTSDGFRTSWGNLVRRAGLHDADRTFHDLRGTAVTRLALAGCTEAEISTIVGMSLFTVRHYLSHDPELAENAMRKLERLMGDRR